jgi:hypothetical protein
MAFFLILIIKLTKNSHAIGQSSSAACKEQQLLRQDTALRFLDIKLFFCGSGDNFLILRL